MVDDLEDSIPSYETNFGMDYTESSQLVLQETCKGNEDKEESSVSALEGNDEDSGHSERSHALFDLDLNIPSLITPSDIPEELSIDKGNPGFIHKFHHNVSYFCKHV